MAFEGDFTLRKVLAGDINSEDGTATPSPRSTSNSCNVSPRESPSRTRTRSRSMESEFEEDLQKQDDEDDYYAFLRELAGSFDGTYDSEDDDSDSGSEDEVGTEIESGHSGKKQSLELSNQDGKLTTLEPLARGPRKEEGLQANPCLVPKDSSHERRAATVRVASPSTGSSTRPSEGDGFDAISEASDDEDRLRRGQVDPEYDLRDPVEDDYDVIQAIQMYADENPRDQQLQQHEDLRHAISLLRSQAHALAAPADNPLLDSKLQAHYGSVRCSLLEEAQQLETKLAELDTDRVRALPNQ